MKRRLLKVAFVCLSVLTAAQSACAQEPSITMNAKRLMMNTMIAISGTWSAGKYQYAGINVYYKKKGAAEWNKVSPDVNFANYTYSVTVGADPTVTYVYTVELHYVDGMPPALIAKPSPEEGECAPE